MPCDWKHCNYCDKVIDMNSGRVTTEKGRYYCNVDCYFDEWMIEEKEKQNEHSAKENR